MLKTTHGKQKPYSKLLRHTMRYIVLVTYNIRGDGRHITDVTISFHISFALFPLFFTRSKMLFEEALWRCRSSLFYPLFLFLLLSSSFSETYLVLL